MFMTKRHSTSCEAGHPAKCHHRVSRDIMLCLGAETWPKNDGKKTGGWGKLGFIDPLFHIVNCSWIWNPPPRDLLHKQKKLGKSLGRFYVIRFVFYGAELFLGFEIPTQSKIKLLKFSWQVLTGFTEWVLCSIPLVSENWDWKEFFSSISWIFCVYHEIMISFTS